MSNGAFFVIHIPGWLLFVYLVAAQCTSAVNYAIGIKMGAQEPQERITAVGVAFFKGYAGADLVFYVPLLGVGLLGHYLEASWAPLVLSAALGITVYWPIACLWTVNAARGAEGWDLPKEKQYWIVLPLIAIWGAIGIGLLIVAV